MSEHRVDLAWHRSSDDFRYETYSRDHTWTFESGVHVLASAAPQFRGNPTRVDPEACFVASIASCHLLTFLAIAARKRWTIDDYTDAAVGTLAENEQGHLAVTHVVLRPRIVFSGEIPTPDAVRAAHDLAHQQCFIANSVRTRIDVEMQLV